MSNNVEKNAAKRFYPIAAPDIGDLEAQYVTDAVRSGWVSSLGSYILEFERGFAEFCGSKYGIATSNGTTALHLALEALRLGPGDEVIVPSLTFVATANVVTYVGATPVFVDVEADTWCIDPLCVERALTPRTRAVIAVHLYGHPANMDALRAVIGTRDIALIEDAAEAHGARHRGHRVGSVGDIGVFSFYGNKIITTGEGGIILTEDARLAERCSFLRDHAMSPTRRYWHPEVGFNYRITNLQAALGLAQLRRIDELIAKRDRIGRWYRDMLATQADVAFNPQAPWASTVFWLACALLPERVDRTAVMQQLKAEGVDTRPFFVPMHRLPMYERARMVLRATGQPAVADALAEQGINLPTAPSLGQDDVAYITERLVAAISRARG